MSPISTNKRRLPFLSYFSNLEYSQLKKHFIFSKILPLNPIPVQGAESAPFGGFSCAAHLLNDLRSPNLVTFPKYYRLTLFPSGRDGGFSCAAHLLIDLRSPNMVTFPNFQLRIGWCTSFPKSVIIGGSRTGFRGACSGVFDTKHSQG